MGTKLAGRNDSGGTTDHSTDIELLRNAAAQWKTGEQDSMAFAMYSCAADLLEDHDRSGISLNYWDGPRALVEVALKRVNGGTFIPCSCCWSRPPEGYTGRYA